MGYVIERLGDISGKTYHPSLEEALAQLKKEYPRQEDIIASLIDIVGTEKVEAVFKYLKNTLNIDQYIPERQTPDPEDDRILIWEAQPDGSEKVVWHFSGWHWNTDEFGLPQGTLPGDDKPLYTLAND